MKMKLNFPQKKNHNSSYVVHGLSMERLLKKGNQSPFETAPLLNNLGRLQDQYHNPIPKYDTLYWDCFLPKNENRYRCTQILIQSSHRDGNDRFLLTPLF